MAVIAASSLPREASSKAVSASPNGSMIPPQRWSRSRPSTWAHSSHLPPRNNASAPFHMPSPNELWRSPSSTPASNASPAATAASSSRPSLIKLSERLAYALATWSASPISRPMATACLSSRFPASGSVLIAVMQTARARRARASCLRAPVLPAASIAASAAWNASSCRSGKHKPWA